jgi:ABC-type bacteriocin/lantibiotic exporter with double-glycine peptidase domain
MVLVTMIVAALASLASLIAPLQIAAVIDEFFFRRSVGTVVLLRFAVLTAISAMFGYLTMVLHANLYNQIVSVVGTAQFRAIIQSDLRATLARSRGQLHNDVDRIAESTASLFTATCLPTANAILTVLIAMVVLGRINVLLTAMTLAFFPMWFLVLRPGGKRLRRIRAEVITELDKVRNFIADRLSFAGLVRIQSFGVAHHEAALLQRSFDGISAKQRGYSTQSALSATVLTLLSTSVAPLLLLIMGAAMMSHHQTTPGVIVAFLYVQPMLLGPLRTLASAQTQVMSAMPTLERILTEGNQTDESRLADLGVGQAVLIKNVRLRYDHNGFDLFVRELAITQRDFIFVEGESGAGKSTLCLLLAGLYRPDSGERYTIPGSRIVYVPQIDSPMAATIRENLTYANSMRLSSQEILSALAAVELDVRLASAVNGDGAENSDLTSTVNKLSAGELQRLALARALLHDATILILDEALSGVDEDQESRILQRIFAWRSQPTLIVVSHRKRGARDLATGIVVVKSGSVSDVSYERDSGLGTRETNRSGVLSGS